MDAKLAKIYYGPGGYWKGSAVIKKLAEASKVPEETAKKWLIRQALWQIYLPAPRRIPRPKFDVPTPNKVHQADLLFLPHDKLPCGRKVFKYALTVVDVASRYKEAEALTSKNSDEVAQAFQKIYKHGPLKWPEMLQVDPRREWALSQKRWTSTKHISGVGRLTFTLTRPLLNVSSAPWLSGCSGTSTPWKCYSLRASGPLPGSKTFLKLFRL